ncbi:lipid droplet-associated protein [Lolliginicoccus suaedae]|uniref:lipid droplet-associated protein n=1 Tax=Lolliginicoccus suaedae TaxID=2605429 RepID=UPI0011EF7AA4|nr:lipid droplet-associated protein [Lolliginicoccus suaedae]
MRRPPFAARVMAGIAVTLVEETRRLPSTAATFPMTAVSQVLQTSMRMQQKMTELAIKGDQAFVWLYPPQDEPEWATFDEDRDSVSTVARPAGSPAPKAVSAPAASAAASGRFALYSAPVSPAKAVQPPRRATVSASSRAISVALENDVFVPAIAARIAYDTLTLAQLRARLRKLSRDELSELLRYEEQKFQRAPFQTMLANRITTVSGN